ncbi:MAG: ATP-binding protein [Ktedonobacteraceae bacterium]
MSKRQHKQTSLAEDNLQPQESAPAQSSSTGMATEAVNGALPKPKPSYLEAMITHTPDAMIVLDENFHILDLNPATTSMLSCTPEQALGHDCAEFLRCCNLNRMELCGTSSCPLVRVLQNKQALPNEELILADTCEVSASITPIEADNGELQAVFIARDVSALKVANRVRSNFVSMVSHELRTPLNSVHGFIDLIVQGHMGDLNPDQLKYLKYTQEGVQQLISIVEDILFMTRSDVGQFEIKQQEVNFRVVAKQVVGSLELQAQKAGVLLRKDIPSPAPILYADPQRMKQVLNNLVTNAIKFTPPGGTVTISARPYDARFALISVTDTGYGIPEDDRSRVFERFYQSNHSLQSKLGGYGLGLSIAKLIVEQHGGIIDFVSSVNKGTTFYFTAPLHVPRPRR